MPKARNRFERSEQVLAWLKGEWPPGRPVQIRWRAEIKYKDKLTGKFDQCCGETWRITGSRTLTIDLSKRKLRAWDEMADTLIHEYAHVRTWGPASLENHPKCDDHPPGFWATYGEMIDRWNHQNGHLEATDIEVG